MTAQYPADGQDNFVLGLIVATGVAVLGVVAWAVLAEAIQVRTAFVAFGVALGCAAVFRRFAPRNPAAPIAVVVLTVLSALVGLLASQYAIAAHDLHLSFFTVVKDVPLRKVPHFMTIGTNAFDWIIVAISGYSGYQASMRLRNAGGRMGPPPGYGQPPGWGAPPAGYAPPPAPPAPDVPQP